MGGNKFLKVYSKIDDIFKENGYSSDVALVVKKLFEYINKKGMLGGCHAISSVLYVALSELNLNPQLMIGVCKIYSKPPFDHSWIVLDGKIIDIAIFLPLDSSYGIAERLIILDKNVDSNKGNKIEYGINTDLPFDFQTEMAIKTNFSDYMSDCPWEINGLWSVLKMILPSTITFDIEQLKQKYKSTQRTVVR